MVKSLESVAGLLAAAVLLSSAPAAADDCELRGERVQWIADDCLRQLQTDDEIAASACIEAGLRQPFASDCAAQRHYKQRLCRATLAADASTADIERCLRDPAVMGPVVRDGGVGR